MITRRTELIRRIKRFQVANHACMMIKYSKDDRYDKAGIATHDLHVTSAYACSTLLQMKERAKDFGVIGIDEGQFVSDQCIYGRGVRHSVKSRTPWRKSVLKSRNQKLAEIKSLLSLQNFVNYCILDL